MAGGNIKTPGHLKRNVLLLYICLFVLGALVFRMSVHFCGKSMVHIYDAQEQTLPFLKYLNLYYRELIRGILHGDFHIKMFDYSLGFGQDPLQTVSYYGIADPLHFPVIFFRQTSVLHYYYFLLLFRPFLAGVTFIGMCFHFKKANYMVPFSAMFYVCSAWSLFAFSVHPSFMNFMILLPMIIAGIDKVMFGESPVLFILTVFLGGCVGFYFLYMVSICMFVFAVVRLFCCRNDMLTTRAHADKGQGESHSKTGKVRHREAVSIMAVGAVRIILRSIGFYLIGLMMSFFIFLPTLMGLMDSIRGETSFLPDNLFIYPLKEMIRMFSGAVFLNPSYISLGIGMTGLFCVIAVLAGRRGELRILTVICLVCWFLPAWSVLMSGFSMPNYRWFFAVVLLSAYLCTDLPEYVANATLMQRILFVMSGCAVIIAAKTIYPTGKSYVFLLVLSAISGAMLLFVSLRQCKRQIRGLVCTALICTGCIVNVLVFFNPLWFGRVNEFSGKDVEKRIDHALIGTVKNIPGYNPAYRTETGFPTTFNIPSVLQIPSIRVYGSIIPKSVSEFAVKTENNSMTTPFSIRGFDGRTALMELCSVRYYLSSSGDIRDLPFGYDEEYEEGKVTAYLNRYALSPGVVFYRTLNAGEMEHINGIEKQSLMLQGAVLEKPDTMTVPVDSLETGVKEIPFEITQMHGVSIKDKKLSFDRKAENAWVDVTAELPENCEIYIRIKGYESEEKIVFQVEREDGKKSNLLGRDRYWAMGQKDFSSLIEWTGKGEGRTAHYRITFSNKCDCTLEAFEFYSFNLGQFEKNAGILSNSCMHDVHFGRNNINGSIRLEKPGLLCMSVPYSKGWTVYVDGEKRECLRADYLFMAVQVPDGEHVVEFRYLTPGLIPGVSVSVIGLIGFIIVLGAHRRQLLSDIARDKGSYDMSSLKQE